MATRITKINKMRKARQARTSGNRNSSIADMSLTRDDMAANRSARLRNANRRQFVNINGTSVENTPTAVRVVAMHDILTSNDSISPGTESNLNQMAIKSLGGLNMVIRDDIRRNYSLLETCNPGGLLENSNIINPNLNILEPGLQDPTVDKFVNKEDPFFELDDGRPTYKRNKHQFLKRLAQKDVTKIAADMFDQNTRKGAGSPNLIQLTKYNK